MNISEAFQRVDALKKNIEQAGELAVMLRRDDESKRFLHGDVHFSFPRYNGKGAALSAKKFADFLELQCRSDQQEIDRLQPVIDMANAALRGIAK